jgi:hypothetical protein
MKMTPIMMNIEGQNMLYIWNVSLKMSGIRKKPPTAITMRPEVLPPDDPIVITRPIVSSSIGQLKIIWSIKAGKKPVFLITRNSPARTRITPIKLLLFVR